MNIPMSWMREYVDVNDSAENFIEVMTMIGQKVETLSYLGEHISGVIVGKINSIEKHPDADKLVVCTVDVGKPEKLTIVTGADNVFEGAYIPVAVHGATLADGTKIKKGKLRGVVSEGMLCSIQELGYSQADYPESPEHGIYIFTEEQEIGADVCPILLLKEEVVEYEIVNNRPDCFSVTGIAREAAAAYDLPLKLPDVSTKDLAGGNAAEYVSVAIKNPERCPRYSARVVKNVKIEPSPLWMRHRLRAAGLRPINNIVDITNYVMLELGQPMHAFDIDAIEGGIIVRDAYDGEPFTTLDGNHYTLDSTMTVIADHKKAVAIGGVMGGENSKVTGNAKAVLFESANFNGQNIRLTAKKLGMRTDASSKYEKGLDPNIAEMAVNRAVHLVELLGAGEAVSGIVDCYPNKRERWSIPFDMEKVNGLLGTQIPEPAMREYLKCFEIDLDTQAHVTHIPTFRPDLVQLCDLAEEVVRKYGYDKVASTLVTGTPTMGRRTYSQMVLDVMKDTMVAQGFYEGMTYSFESPKVFEKLRITQDDALRKAITIANPLGEDFSIMRTSTMNGLLTAMATNYNKRNDKARLFLVENIYCPKALPMAELPDEKLMLTAGMYGSDMDFYSMKGVAQGLLMRLGIDQVRWDPVDTLSFMHPGRTAQVSVAGEVVGSVGQFHPQTLENYQIGVQVFGMNFEIEKLVKHSVMVKKYKELPKFPGVSRDIALLALDDVLVRDMDKVIQENGGGLLYSFQLFDIYKGKQIEKGYKSVAYSLIFRSVDRTLTDEEVALQIDKITHALKNECGAKLRESAV